jgi:hypothetical protein
MSLAEATCKVLCPLLLRTTTTTLIHKELSSLGFASKHTWSVCDWITLYPHLSNNDMIV